MPFIHSNKVTILQENLNCLNILDFFFNFYPQNFKILTFSNEEIEHCESNSVTTEHVVTTCSHSLNRHACSSPDYVGMLYLCPEFPMLLPVIWILTHPWVALEMCPGHWERSYKHCNTAKQENSSRQCKESAQENEPSTNCKTLAKSKINPNAYISFLMQCHPALLDSQTGKIAVFQGLFPVCVSHHTVQIVYKSNFYLTLYHWS